MYVRVKYQGKIYYSYVFAHFEFDYMPQYVVYDSIEKKFDIVAYFSKKCDGNRQVGFMNENESDFIRKEELKLNMGIVKKCVGYPWLINNVNLLKDIEEGKPLSEEYVRLATEMNSIIDPDAWNEVYTKKDAEDMMYHVGGFHDWYLIGMEVTSDPYVCNVAEKVQLRFSSQAAFDVLVEFEEGVYIKYGFSPANRIYLSSIVFNGEHKYWVDGEEELSFSDIGNFDYVQGNYLRWKFVIKKDQDW